MSDAGLKYGPVIFEGVSPNAAFMTRVKKILLTAKTKYQEVQIVELYEYGRALVLDGYIQSTENDEFIYHESLVHPIAVTHPHPQKALIVGGGEGATLREILKHAPINEAVMVDIDGELIEFAKKYLDFMHQGSFNDPRSKLLIEDGYKYVKEVAPKKYFDIIILDLTDPYGPEISKKLYSREFYAMIKSIMKDNGIMVTQAGNSFFYPKTYARVLKNVKANFSIVREYWVWVPSFGYACNFIAASDVFDPATLDENEVNNRLKLRDVKTRFYDGTLHLSLFKGKVLLGKVPEE